ncbi:DUF5131 family protein [Mycobacteroides abscessus]|uniref:DUF5131 family protein n=1 Tax=Mycobacteroides abscessus TaxID=36809 RepID=UPI000926FD9C|nr:phage Gp37/Gp68 family protein [Mycobacteroides abscessus]SIF58354.1 bacteriophage protein gp37 [Mycobacteroides abscessus subsp. abscessus]
MGDKTRIEWADATWSPVTGCTRVSNGCLNCYIERSTPIRIAGRKFDGEGIGSSLAVQLHPNRLDWPLRKRDGKKIFVCSQADLFHSDVPDEYIAKVFAVMALAPHHTFQVLTKRHDRMRSLLNSAYFLQAVGRVWAEPPSDWPLPRDWRVPVWPLPNVWLGVSAEDQKRADLRIPALLHTPAAVRFVSAEPLLGPIDLHGDPIGKDSVFWIGHLDWVIAGGESGPGARPMHPDWARSLRDQCVAAGVPFLFKQWGEWVPERLGLHGCNAPAAFLSTDGQVRLLVDGKPAYAPFAPAGDMTIRRVGKKRAGRELDGRTWDQYPGVA